MKRILLVLFFCTMAHGMDHEFLPFINQDPQGTLTVICGPMYSGKTEELMKRVKIARLQLLDTLVCKHQFDTRLADKLSSKGILSTMAAVPVIHPFEILDLVGEAEVVAIDEVQFFSKELIAVIKRLISRDVKVIVSGLDMDFKKEPFGECIPSLMCMAQEIVKLKAVCSVCRQHNACYTQRLVNNTPASSEDELVIIDDGQHPVTYEPRCKDCHRLNLRKSKSLDCLNLVE